jgi:hypothetical protein
MRASPQPGYPISNKYKAAPGESLRLYRAVETQGMILWFWEGRMCETPDGDTLVS